MVGRVTPPSAAIGGDGVAVAALVVGLVVHLAGDAGLSCAELGFLAACAAACSGGGEAVAGAFGHQGVLELGDGSEDLEEHAADGGGGVDALVQDDEVHTPRVELLGQVDEVLEGSAEPVELG